LKNIKIKKSPSSSRRRAVVDLALAAMFVCAGAPPSRAGTAAMPKSEKLAASRERCADATDEREMDGR